MKIIISLLAIACSLTSLQPARAAESSPARPNIVVILTDDMGYSDLGCYGGEIETPNLDALAAGGLRFTQFYNTGRCCPTRASLMTGLYPHQAGVGHMMEKRPHPGYQGDLNQNCVTIAEVLQGAGYGTYMCGKWHLTPAPKRGVKPNKHNWPLQRGFDHFYGTIMGGGSYFDPATLTRDNRLIVPENYDDYYYTDAITDNAVKFIEERDPERPFFLYVAYTAAHWPMHAKPADIAKYQGKYDKGWNQLRRERYERMQELGLIDSSAELSPNVQDWESIEDKEWYADRMEVYAAMVDCMDQGVGRIVESLRDEEQLDNTLILYLQDNGGCQEELQALKPPKTEADLFPNAKPLGPKQKQFRLTPVYTRDGKPLRLGRGVTPGPPDTYGTYGIEWANASNTPFRMYKHFVHEGGISTPLIAHWPDGFTRRGEFERQPGHLIDIMATCVDLAGAEYPTQRNEQSIQPLEGVSLKPAFNGESLNRTAPIFWEHEGHRAIRDGDWKLVAKGKNGPWELYNLAADRSEMHALSEQHPEKAKQLADAWQAWAERANVLPLYGR